MHWYCADVDVAEPDEKSLITYVSSLYDVFPDVPSMEQSLRDNVCYTLYSLWSLAFLCLVCFNHVTVLINLVENHYTHIQGGPIKLDLRKRIVKCLLWSVALYASETWTISKTVMKRIKAFEMWIRRKMDKISWTAKVSNAEVLNRVNEKSCIINTMNRRKRRWLGHVLRF